MRRVLKVTEAKECKPLSSSRVDRWRRDRLILSNQIQNLLVTIRSNERFSANARFSNPEQSTEHPLLRQLKELQREIMAPTLECHVNEAAILKPFCDLCTSREMSDTIVGVALASLSNLIDLRCSFISKSGLEMILGIVYASKREVRDFSTHEVLLVRRLNLCVSCAGHPSARGLSEDTFVDMIHHAYKLAVHSMGSPLLRRTAEQCMKSIVTSLYSFVVENRSGSFASNKKHEEGTNDPMISVEKDEEEKEESTLSGCVMLRHICSLIRGRDNGDASNLDIQRSDAKESSKIAAVQLEGFLLVQCMLFVVHDFICNPGWEELLYTVQHELCRALLITGVSTNNIIVLFQILRTIHIVVKMASACVVPQTFSFIRAIHIDPLIRIAEELHSGLMSPRTASSPRLAASPSVPVGPSFHMNVTRMMDLYERRELLLESLVEFSGDPNFATFCYLQYDLSKRFSPLLDRLCTSLVENCFCMTDEETSDLLKKGNRGGGGGGVSYDFSADGFLTQMDALALEALNSFLHQTMLSFSHPSPLPPLPPVPAELTSLIEFRLEQKKLLMDFASRFRANAIKDGIPFLLEKATRVHSESSYRDVVRGAQGGQGGVQMDAPALILVEPAGGREVGMCLFHLSAMLDKRALGDYLGELGRESPAPIADGTQESIEALAAWEMKRETEHLQVGTVRFFEEQLKGFLEEFDYHNKPLLSCIRETVYHMCVPGEAQKIDRVMEAFAKVWMKSNSDVGKEINPFCSEQGPFIIAFSLILLNTDQHSGKMVKPMTLEDFRRMHRDSDGGSSLPEGYLDELYNDVKAHPIIMAEMIDAGFTNDVTWALEMHELDPSDDLLSKDPVLRYSKQLTGLHTIDEAMFQVLHPFVFSTVWKHCLRAFSNTLYACGSSLEHYLMEEDDIMDHAHTETKYPLPAAEEAYNRALEGLLFLAHTATHFGVRSAVDHVILVLLSQLSLDMEDAHGSVVRLGNQPFSLRCLQTLFSVLHDCVDMVMDSWGELGRFFSTAFLFGMFAKEASKVPASTSLLLSSPDSAESWEELLCHNPGIVVGGGVRRETSDRGWFAALLGGSSNTPERLKAQEEEKQRAIKRVKALFPSMEEFLNMIDSLEKKPQQQFFCALRDMGVMNTKNAAESYAASYTIILITEVAIRHSKDPVVLERYIKLCQQITSSISAIFEQPKSSDEANNNNSSNSNVNNNNNNNNNNGNNGNRARRVEEDEISIFDIGQSNRSEAYNYWLSLSVRVVRALLRAVVMFVCSDMHHETGIQILKLLTAAPQKLFTAAVAPLLSGTLLRLLTEERNFPHVPNRPLLMELFNTFCITARAHASFLVQQRIRKALIIIVKDERYDILRDAEDLVKTIVTCALEFSSENAESAGSPNQLGDTVQEERSESLANYLTVLCRRLVEMYGMGCVANKEKEWHQVWITSLCGLCVLVVSSRQSRDRGEALLCLQHSLLDSNIHQLPGTAIALLYEDVIFPLTEEICAPSPANVMGMVGTSSSSNKSSNNSSNNNNNNASATLASTEAFTKNPLGFFGTRRTAKSGNGASGCSSSSSVMKSRNQVTPTDLKCRVVSLLTRVFLQYVKFLGETPDVMQELWQRILGTLYALYTVPTERALSPTVSDAHGAKGNDGVTDDDGAFLREAIQEAVKNMIYVLSSTLSEPECVYTLRQAPYFWTSTKNLLRPFDFAEPLLAHIDNLDS